MEHRRLVLFGEPPKQSSIQAEIIKRFAGGTDKISTRGLHQDEREFVPVFKAVLACNSIPKVSEDSYAVWRRMRIVDFPVKFSKDPDPRDPMSQMADESLPRQLPDWAPHLAGYLLKYVCRLRADGLTPPRTVERSTEDYRDDNDDYAEYRLNTLERCSDDLWLQWMDLLENFRPWHDARFPKLSAGQRAKDVQAVRRYFIGKLGPIKNTQRKGQDVNGFFGWRLRSPFFNDQ